jgi:hypothetical protein
MFNCAAICRSVDGSWSFHLKDDTDTVYFIYRQTPVSADINSIYLTTLDIDNAKLLTLPAKALVTNAERGDKEDARFFLHNGLVGLSYTDKFTMGLSWLDRDMNLDVIKMPFGEISKLEKNWTFFDHKDRFLGIRFYRPLVFYDIDIDAKSIVPYKKWEWDMSDLFNEVRGGAPPVLVGDRYYIFTHTAKSYLTQVLTIDAETLEPLEFTPEVLFPMLDTKFQFICGALFDERRYEWVLSLGIDDLYCGIIKLSHTLLLKKLKDIRLKREMPIDEM